MKSKSTADIPGKFTIGLIQMAPGADLNANLKKAVSMIERAAGQGAEVICLPELFRSKYFCQTEDIRNFQLAETIPGPSTLAVSKVAKKQKVAVVVPLFEKRAMGIYHNSAAIIDSNGEIAGV